LNQPALELCECREDKEYQLTRGGRCIDCAVADGSESDAAIAKLINDRDEMPNRPSQSIESPHEQDIAAPKFVKARVEARAVV